MNHSPQQFIQQLSCIINVTYILLMEHGDWLPHTVVYNIILGEGWGEGLFPNIYDKISTWFNRPA